MCKEPTGKAQFLLDVVEGKIIEDGHEALRRWLCVMIRHKELRSLAEEIIQTEHLTKGRASTCTVYSICLDKSFELFVI